MTYKKPEISQGQNLVVSACKGSTCNGANRATGVEPEAKDVAA